MGEGTASMIEETLLKGLSPGLVHRSRTNITGSKGLCCKEGNWSCTA
jgi:hypothetical protein